MRWMTMLMFLVLACDSGGGLGGRDAGDGFDAGTVPDSGVEADAGDGELIRSEGRPEVCGNAVDDDGNGRIDDGCACVVGTVRPCWMGPLTSRALGICHDGQQRCEPEGAEGVWGLCVDQQLPESELRGNGFDDDCDGEVDESGGLCVPRNNQETGLCSDGNDDDCDSLVDCADPDCAEASGCEGGCEESETLCWGGRDDDCDGLRDCEDPDCAGDVACTGDGVCPEGQTPIYSERTMAPRPGPSGVESGDGMPIMPMHCGESRCGDGQVEVRQGGDASLCAPPPYACEAGLQPTWREGRWRCDPPCELIVQYGFIYGFQRMCAGQPNPVCPSGQVPTFREETQEWICDEECNNGQYDRVWIDGLLVCVPC